MICHVCSDTFRRGLIANRVPWKPRASQADIVAKGDLKPQETSSLAREYRWLWLSQKRRRLQVQSIH
jgi:hypothetical protein